LLASALAAGTVVMAQTEDRSDDRERRVALAQRIERLEALKAIEKLQYAYGYYQDRFLYDHLADLFTDDDPRVQWMDAVWTGKRGVTRFWLEYFNETFAEGTQGPVAGRLLDLPQWQGVITLAPDGTSAKGQFKTIGRLAFYREKENWISGIYDTEYVKEDGIWKIKSMRFCQTWSAKSTDGVRGATHPTDSRWLPPPTGHDRIATDAERCPEGYPYAPPVAPDFVSPGALPSGARAAAAR